MCGLAGSAVRALTMVARSRITASRFTKSKFPGLIFARSVGSGDALSDLTPAQPSKFLTGEAPLFVPIPSKICALRLRVLEYVGQVNSR
jgi:hypothetical protein